MSLGKKATLSTGHEMPTLGYGTWQSKPGEVGECVLEALKTGYRHLDLALVYGNQDEVASGLRRAFAEVPGLKREDVFITSKLWNNEHRPDDVAKALDGCLAQLGLDYLDLYLMHWPVAFKPGEDLFPLQKGEGDEGDEGDVELYEGVTISQTWEAMTKLPKSKVRSVGVSNFTREHIETVVEDTGVVPAVLQIERHPRLPQPELVKFCKEKNIHVTAYSPFGNNAFDLPLLMAADEVKAVAENMSKATAKSVTPSQVILAWGQVGGHSVIPKSVTPSRIRQNFDQVELSADDVAALDKMGEKPQRFNIPYVANKPRWDINVFQDEKEKAAKHQVVLKL